MQYQDVLMNVYNVSSMLVLNIPVFVDLSFPYDEDAQNHPL